MTLTDRLSLEGCHAANIDAEVVSPQAQWGERRWYAVYVANREAYAQSHLGDQGFTVFLPRSSKNVRHARQIKTVLAPLFPRYLFIALDLQRDRWRSVNGTRGVSSIVAQNERPCQVAVGVVESLAACCDANGVMHFPDLRPGQSVRVVAGPFAEQLGVLERMGSAERVRVLLDIMNCQVAVVLSKSSIAPN